MGNEFVSSQTGRRFPVNGGIPHFLRYEPVEDAADAARLERLNEAARLDGWRIAVDKVWPEVARYVTDEGRRAFIDLLPTDPGARILEIGAGLGQHTITLAQRGRAVHALEVVPGQARFVAQRCAQSGRNNVFVACAGDDCFLPYADGCFDAVVANLVFEWCGTREKHLRPREAQERLLREIRRVMKTEGVLFLATKNRFAIRYVLGGRDENMEGMRFGNALPRWITGRCARGHSRQVRGLLHSYRGLQQMLFASGLSVSSSYWAIPDMRYPELYVLTDPASVRQAQGNGCLFKGKSRSLRLMRLIPSRLVKFLAPGLVFLARAGGGPRESSVSQPCRSDACQQK